MDKNQQEQKEEKNKLQYELDKLKKKVIELDTLNHNMKEEHRQQL